MDMEVAVELLEALVDKGLGEIGRYLREKTKKDIFMIDHHFMKHYPKKMLLNDKSVWRFLESMPGIQESQYYYCKNSRRLVYAVEQGEARLWILLKEVQSREIVQLTEVVGNARLSLKNYLKNEISLAWKLQEEKHKFIEDLFMNKGHNMRFFREKMGLQLDMDNSYAVMIVVFANGFSNSGVLKQLSREFAQEDGISPIEPVFWKEMHIIILADASEKQEGRDACLHNEKRIGRWKKFMEKKLATQAIIGIGSSYCLPDLYKSFDEAHIALTFCLQDGKNSMVQYFSQMGIFTELFLHERSRICKFCRHTLDKLLEYDHDCDADLQETLRALLACNFNWKATAERLFVHVNTLRYRYDKIEQLLNVDLSSPDVRFNLYAAIRVGDVLKKLDLMQPAYIGNISLQKTNKCSKKQSKTIF